MAWRIRVSRPADWQEAVQSSDRLQGRPDKFRIHHRSRAWASTARMLHSRGLQPTRAKKLQVAREGHDVSSLVRGSCRWLGRTSTWTVTKHPTVGQSCLDEQPTRFAVFQRADSDGHFI